MDNNYNNELDKEIENKLSFNEFYDNSSISSDISDVSSSEILDEEDSNSENDYSSNQKENFLYEEKQKSFSEVITKNINKNKDSIVSEKEKNKYTKSKEETNKILNYKNNVKNYNNKFNLQLNNVYHQLKQKQYDGYFNSLDECNEKIFSKFIKRYII